ncbi:DUF4158 domain-containing protein [Streptomyces triculaminicus]|uniref:DUF4158 domain-containing protein n=1 Tax=Streptomyces triculaminicus TaxID=2816232 RepID=UPI0037D78C45
MLGTFLSAPAEVPVGAAEFVAEQLGIEDPSCLKLYPERLPTQHEHAREIRRLLGGPRFRGRRPGPAGAHRRAGVGVERGAAGAVRPGGDVAAA